MLFKNQHTHYVHRYSTYYSGNLWYMLDKKDIAGPKFCFRCFWYFLSRSEIIPPRPKQQITPNNFPPSIFKPLCPTPVSSQILLTLPSKTTLRVQRLSLFHIVSTTCGNYPNLPNIFQTRWNHQLIYGYLWHSSGNLSIFVNHRSREKNPMDSAWLPPVAPKSLRNVQCDFLFLVSWSCSRIQSCLASQLGWDGRKDVPYFVFSYVSYVWLVMTKNGKING